MTIKASTYTIGVTQKDGRVSVTETHIDDDGMEYVYEYLNDGIDPAVVMQERTTFINSTLAQREAARLLVQGAGVPVYKYDFLMRFDPAERIGVREAAKSDPIVADFMHLLDATNTVHPTLARPGLMYLASIEVLTSERAEIIGAD